MTITELSQELSLETIVSGEEEKVSDCYIGDLLSWVMSKGQEGQVWLTVLGHVNVMAVAKLTGFSGVILCEDAPLDEEARIQGEKQGIPIYKTKKTIYETALEIGKLLE